MGTIVVTLPDIIMDSMHSHDGGPAGIRRSGRDLFQMIFGALEGGAKGSITVAVACGVAGVISGCITVTGLASKLLSAIVSVAGGHMMVALVLTMLCCIVLGMGVPTTANYCIMAATCAPILTDPSIGVEMMAAHFFVFYFGIVADITPPVALAAYAGSAIAKADPMKTGINATKLAIAAFIVPYIFALSPQMLFIDVTSAFQGGSDLHQRPAGYFRRGGCPQRLPLSPHPGTAAGGYCRRRTVHADSRHLERYRGLCAGGGCAAVSALHRPPCRCGLRASAPACLIILDRFYPLMEAVLFLLWKIFGNLLPAGAV